MYSSTFLINLEYSYLYLSTFQRYFDSQVLSEYIFKVLLAFLWHYFPNTKWVARVSKFIASVSSVADKWDTHKPGSTIIMCVHCAG